MKSKTIGCPSCKGKGVMDAIAFGLRGDSMHSMKCPNCRGSGKVAIHTPTAEEIAAYKVADIRGMQMLKKRLGATLLVARLSLEHAAKEER